mgnify:FL=1
MINIRIQTQFWSIVLFLPIFFIALNCSSYSNRITNFDSRKDQIRKKYINDGSLSVFSADIDKINDGWVIKGETTDTSAYESILRLKDSLFKDTDIKNNFILLPDPALGDKVFGIVNVSVTPMREEPRHSSQMVDQAIMGNVVRLLKNDNGWYLVQTHYDYVGWINKSGLFVTNESGKNNWQEKADKSFTGLQNLIRSEPDNNSLPISDIVLNNVVISKPYDDDWSLIHLPDGRKGYLKSKSLRYFNTKNQNNIHSGDIISDAKRMMGTPYLWGGNSTKGNDCSGFTQTVFKANNIQIPRDARQQALIGTPILPSQDWSNILPGDLLFFGRKNRVTHVGISLGQKDFIHQGGRVDINSLDESSPNFNSGRLKSFLFIRRILYQ